MPRDIILINTNNFIGNSSYKYQLPQAIRFENSKLSVYSIAIYNSTYNISSTFNNNTFSINWLGTTYNCTIPNGYYAVTDLNTYLQYFMYSNNLYVNSNNNPVYFIALITNSIQYKIQLNINYIPTSSQASVLGYSLPSSASWSWPSSYSTPQITLSSGLQSILGMKNYLTYPQSVQSSNYVYLSDTYPVLSPVFSYIFTCNLVDSKSSNVPTLLFQLPLTSSFGNLITFNATTETKLDIRNGSFNEIIVQLFDQNYNLLNLIDPELTITLIIEY
jgi:hypothetical protein